MTESNVIRELSLFSGYGGSTFALKKADIPHRCIGYSDIEESANYIFKLNHGENIPELGDVTKIDPYKLEDFDLLTGGFPCQSFSSAGRREGFESKKTGNLFFEIIRIAEAKMPRYMLLENVEGILSHDDGATMRRVLHELALIGYYVQWKKLRSKDFGIPQNRPRIWFACFREEDDYLHFAFPEPEPLKIYLKDLIEKDAPKKYFLSKFQLDKIRNTRKDGEKLSEENTNPNLVYNLANTSSNGQKFKENGVAFTLYTSPSLIVSGVRKDNVSPTLVSEKELSGIGTLIKQKNVSPTLTRELAHSHGRTFDAMMFKAITGEWRRLMPIETFRLQGFFDDDIKFGNLSDTKLYALAGNGWATRPALDIFKQMFKGNTNKQKGVFDF